MFLIWDKSYFIEPTGNSSKALNTDILETNQKILAKENYESVIPQESHFARFTSSAKNLTSFSMYNSLTIYNEVTKTLNTNQAYSKFYLTAPYWYLGTKKGYETKADIEKCKKCKKADIASFNAILYKYTRKDALKIDSESMKLNLCNHARARQHCFNQVARAIDRADLIVEYSKKEKEA